MQSVLSMKCLSFEIPFLKNEKVLSAFISFKSGIFSNNSELKYNDGLRPDAPSDFIKGDMFVFVPHYPNQLMNSYRNGKWKWPVQTKNKYGLYLTHFEVGTIEIIQHRNRNNKPCIERITEDDNDIIQWITEKSGCKPPFWNSTSEMPLCLTQEETLNTFELLRKIVFGGYNFLNYTRNLPCRGMERYRVEFTDIDVTGVEHANNSVDMQMFFNDLSYKEVKYVRSMDLQSLIGILNNTFTRKCLNNRSSDGPMFIL